MLIGLILLAIVVILTGTLLFEAVFYTEEQQS